MELIQEHNNKEKKFGNEKNEWKRVKGKNKPKPKKTVAYTGTEESDLAFSLNNTTDYDNSQEVKSDDDGVKVCLLVTLRRLITSRAV